MKVPMIATKALTYATRRLLPDDKFEASRTDARILSALGRARQITDEEAKAKHAPAASKPHKSPKKRSRKLAARTEADE
jgi:hypothetical protein